MNKLLRNVSSLALLSFSMPAVSSALLDHFMPYRDFYAEGSSQQTCQDGITNELSNEACVLSPETENLLARLAAGDPSSDVNLDDVADALRELLARGQSVDAIVDALPPFVRQHLPSALQSKHCRFERSGDLAIRFDNDSQTDSGGPYNEFTYLSVICDQIRRFRVVLTDQSYSNLATQSAKIYGKSKFPVELSNGDTSSPAEVSLLSDGNLLSDTVFESSGGQIDIAILASLHQVDDPLSAPDGIGEVSGAPVNSSLIIYELD